jgi:iron complex outermembrane receptor protein
MVQHRNTNSRLRAYLMAGSAAWLAAAGFAQAQTAPSVPPVPGVQAPQASQAPQEIVVTGTRIRGIAPVGSATIPITRDTIAQQGAASTNDILRDVPQITNFGAQASQIGGGTIQNSNINNTYANSVNLRGLGTTATLTLIDGHRIAPGGPSAAFVDVDTIPAIALERVEVVADGASAIYGSDAVAGVVNLRIREPFDGAETQIGGGISDGTSSVALEHTQNSELYEKDRPNLYNDNLTAYGGAPVSDISFPGNVFIGGKAYPIPSGQNGQNFTLSQLGSSSAPNRQSIYDDTGILPAEIRDTFLTKYNQQVTDSIKFFGEAFYTDRKFKTNLVAANSGAGGYTVPSTNPYSPCAPTANQVNTVGAACPANGSLSVLYSWLGDLGPVERFGFSQVYDFTNGLEFRLPYDWKATATTNYSVDSEYNHALAINTNAVNTLLAPPGATVNVNVPGTGLVAVTHPTSIPSLNLFCGIGNCNSPASLAYISGVSITRSDFTREDATLNADGPLFSLPGGTVRLAVGGEFIHDHINNLTYGTSNTATVTSPGIEGPSTEARDVDSAYGELYVPVIGTANAIPFVKRLDLSIAGRFDHYSDFGGTTNPKLGLNWVPIDGLTLHASYGTSFRAPTLSDINPLSTAVIFVNTAAGAALSGASNTVATTNYSALTTVGGHAGLKPETATTYSYGFDYKPTFLEGFALSVNYYNIDFQNRIDTPAYNAGFPTNVNASPIYDPYIVYNPTYYPGRSTITQTQFNALVAAKEASTNPSVAGAPPAASNVVAVIDGTRQNSGTLLTSGFDFNANYHWNTSWGRWQVGGSATYVLDYKYAQVPGGTVLNYVNVYSTIGSPLQFRGRAQFGWSQGPAAATVFVNYENGYHYPNGVNFPINLLPAGVPAGTHGDIDAYTTVDLALSYDTSSLPLPPVVKGVIVRLNVTNLFDQDPPFVLNGTVQYDPTEASQIGRTVAMQVTKRW